MLSVLMQVFVVSSMVYVLWVLYGYSFTFTGGNPFIGNVDKLLFQGIMPKSISATFSKGIYIHELTFAAFQAIFAAITCTLIVGEFAERIKFFCCVVVLCHLVHLQLHANCTHGLAGKTDEEILQKRKTCALMISTRS